ncbi:MAG: hypothetical protein V3S68_05495 [Dehalococcoidia bacterium]
MSQVDLGTHRSVSPIGSPLTNDKPEWCWCCELSIPVGDGNLGSFAQINPGDGFSLRIHVYICSKCRSLDCNLHRLDACRVGC